MGRAAKKRKPGKREPNGRLSRKPKEASARVIAGLDQSERDAISVGLEARERVFGVSPSRSRDQMAGSVVGRLCINCMISQHQYDAAIRFQEDSTMFSMARQSPRQPGAVDLNATKGGIGDYENVDMTLRAVARYEAALAAVQEKQNELRGGGALIAAINHIVIRDIGLPHLVGDLREALNALVRHYGLQSKSAQRAA